MPEQCEACKKQISTLETCILPDGTEKRGAEVTFRESAEVDRIGRVFGPMRRQMFRCGYG